MRSPLSPEERLQLEGLFDRAADLPQAEQRAFVERECGSNAALRARLEGLLAGLQGEDLLTRRHPGSHSRVGTQLGAYRLLEKIGEGGMGEVYAAEQSEPIARKVALKIIRPGMESAQCIARFEAERHALARMTHPNIAQVYDGGTADSGSPYFVMEYVAGLPVTEYCDRHKLSTRRRLEIFLGICEGVQHAHQKGIIHRDLKPSNLLVAIQDGRPIAKIIDFGVARATTGRLVERGLHTFLGQIVGTLDYMSPEQADATIVDIDTRSDVYSLGVVLYQLLSGLLPFEHPLGVDVPSSAVQRAIRKNDPLTPSTRLRRSKNTATARATLHGTDERSLVRQLAGDLDWICMKALEKAPARRYQSASDLAEDLRRHLAHQPVHAGRPGMLYRAGKFVRRNRVGVAAGVFVAAGLIAGVYGIISGKLEALASAQLALAQKPHVDDYRARKLLSEADQRLWPPHPDKIPAMQSWRGRSLELLGNLAADQAALASLRERALEWTPEQRKRDHAEWANVLQLGAWTAQLQRARGQLGGLSGSAQEEAAGSLAELETRVATLEAEAGARLTWEFESEQDQAYHELLSGLVEKLEHLRLLTNDEAELPAALREHGWSMPRRLAFASTIADRSVDGAEVRQRWAEAIAGIRSSPSFSGLELKPQMGLLPLGADPETQLWEFALLVTGEPPERVNGRLRITAESAVVLVLLPGGQWQVGAQHTDPSGSHYDPVAVQADAKPLHQVNIEPFLLSKFELTRAQWQRFNGWEARPGRHSTPMTPCTMVTYTQCHTTAFRLGVRLPDEDEWEYAARGGTTTPWWVGDDEHSLGPTADSPGAMANVLDAGGAAGLPSVMQNGKAAPWSDGYPGLAPIGKFPPNPFGLYDVLGNASEWCSWRAEGAGEARQDGDPPSQRIARGGNFASSPDAARSAFRGFKNTPEFVHPGGGVRPALSLQP